MKTCYQNINKNQRCSIKKDVLKNFAKFTESTCSSVSNKVAGLFTDPLKNEILVNNGTARKMSKYGVFSGLYFLVLGLNTEIYSVNLRIHADTEKYGPEKTPYLDTFYAVWSRLGSWTTCLFSFIKVYLQV